MACRCKPTQISTVVLGAALALLCSPRGQQNVSVCWGFFCCCVCLFVSPFLPTPSPKKQEQNSGTRLHILRSSVPLSRAPRWQFNLSLPCADWPKKIKIQWEIIFYARQELELGIPQEKGLGRVFLGTCDATRQSKAPCNPQEWTAAIT